jgi:hypothetical protein
MGENCRKVGKRGWSGVKKEVGIVSQGLLNEHLPFGAFDCVLRRCWKSCRLYFLCRRIISCCCLPISSALKRLLSRLFVALIWLP